MGRIVIFADMVAFDFVYKPPPRRPAKKLKKAESPKKLTVPKKKI